MHTDHLIRDEAALRALYGPPVEPAVIKEMNHIHTVYRPFIAAATLMVLATHGPHGLDASPRGGPAGFVTIVDDHTLMLPDRPGNNRVDSLRNIVHDPRVGLLFLVPGCGETMRVNGRAELSVDPDLLARFTERGKAPRCVVVVRVETAFIQCSSAIKRAGVWDPARQIARETLPGLGVMLEELRATYHSMAPT